MTTGRRGIILMNLGSPDSTSVKDVRSYLMEFLMDGRVIDYPYLFRLALVGGLIVPLRASNSAEAYRTIWTEEGSPLIVNTRRQIEALQPASADPIVMAMRYGHPGIEDAYTNLLARCPDVEEVLAIPLYPHYAMSSYETAVAEAKKVHASKKYRFRLDFIRPFYNESSYIESLSQLIEPFLEQPFDHLLFSYHGIPGRHIRKTDPTKTHCLAKGNCCDEASPAHAYCYRHQVFRTTELIAERLKLPPRSYSISFQSRLGKGWLEPFTDIRLEQMPSEGIKKLLIVSPAFVSDCLETLEEIAVRGKESFLKAGGESYSMIPCLNDSPSWIATLSGWIKDYAGGKREMLL